MKCLTLHPVWAWLIVHGHKPVENRTWRTKHRGPLLIHASAESARSRRSDAMARDLAFALGIEVPDSVPTGAIVGRVTLDGCWPIDALAAPDGRLSGPWATGPVCWLLARAEAFADPIPRTGRQGLFSVDFPLSPPPLAPCTKVQGHGRLP